MYERCLAGRWVLYSFAHQLPVCGISKRDKGCKSMKCSSRKHYRIPSSEIICWALLKTFFFFSGNGWVVYGQYLRPCPSPKMLLMSGPIFIFCCIKSQIKSLSILSKWTEMDWINARIAERCISLQHIEGGRLNYRKWWRWAQTWSRIPWVCGLGSLLDTLLCWIEPWVSCSSQTPLPTWKPTEISWGQVEARCS